MNTIDRTQCASGGLAGGGDGRPAQGKIVRANGDSTVLRKGITRVGRKDLLFISSGGGGGHGPVARRTVGQVLEDVAQGYVTPEGALRDYGVDVANRVVGG